MTLLSGGWETDPMFRVWMGKAQIDREGTTLRPVEYSVTVYNAAGGDAILPNHGVCVG